MKSESSKPKTQDPSPKTQDSINSRVMRSIAFDFSHHTPHFMNHPRQRASKPVVGRSYAVGGLTAAHGFVGDVRSRDTPDPIPNSEVKSRPPMILQRGKVGHCRLQRPDSGKPGSGLFSLRGGWGAGSMVLSADRRFALGELS